MIPLTPVSLLAAAPNGAAILSHGTRKMASPHSADGAS